MAKQCKALECTNKVFSHGYCSWPSHQALRTDDKYLKQSKKKGSWYTDDGYKVWIPDKQYHKMNNIQPKFEELVAKPDLSNKTSKWYKHTKKKRSSLTGMSDGFISDYKKVYITFFGYSTEDVILCECCGTYSVDIHHIDNKGMGGSIAKNHIENLVVLCRTCHNKCHDDKEFNNQVRILHLENVIKKLKS